MQMLTVTEMQMLTVTEMQMLTRMTVTRAVQAGSARS
jgi:hypothetical protein